MSKRKKKVQNTETLDPMAAGQMLSNVFDACNYEANTVPLSVMSSSENFRKEHFYVQRTIIAVILIILLLLPALFITPDITITQKDSGKPGAPIISIEKHGYMPVKSINATIDSYKLQVHETEHGDYEVKPDRNGTLTVTITLINNQSASEDFEVTGVDVKPPELVSSTLEGGELTIYFTDESGTLDFEAAYAKTMSGEVLKPLRFDAEEMSITFALPKETVNIFVQDKYKNVVQLILTIH